MKIILTIFTLMAGFGVITEVEGYTTPSCHYSINSSELKSSEMETKEIWKDVKGYEGCYEVSNKGLVRSKERIINSGKSFRIVPEKILSSGMASNGYLTVNLWKDSEGKTKTVHSLVAESFLNHKPYYFKLVVNHKDNNKINNDLMNLEIVTNRQNTNQKHLKSTSKYTGVSWVSNRNKWRVRIKVNGINESLGSFVDEYDAHMAYQKRLIEIEND